MYVERSGTVPQQDLSSVLLLANGPSVDAGAELSMERSGTVPQQDLTSVLRPISVIRFKYFRVETLEVS